jgi:hypothetical protein
LPALAWIEGRLGLPVLRHPARCGGGCAGQAGPQPGSLALPPLGHLIFNWLLYGYGVPAAAFIIATRQFGSRADDLLVKVLEAGSVVFRCCW